MLRPPLPVLAQFASRPSVLVARALRARRRRDLSLWVLSPADTSLAERPMVPKVRVVLCRVELSATVKAKPGGTLAEHVVAAPILYCRVFTAGAYLRWVLKHVLGKCFVDASLRVFPGRKLGAVH